MGGKVRGIAVTTQPQVIRALLTSLNLAGKQVRTVSPWLA